MKFEVRKLDSGEYLVSVTHPTLVGQYTSDKVYKTALEVMMVLNSFESMVSNELQQKPIK